MPREELEIISTHQKKAAMFDKYSFYRSNMNDKGFAARHVW